MKPLNTKQNLSNLLESMSKRRLLLLTPNHENEKLAIDGIPRAFHEMRLVDYEAQAAKLLRRLNG